VDGTYLTEDQLPTPIDSSASSREFVNEWVTTELLYQEALRRNMVKTEEMQRRLEEVEKKMAIETLLNQELYEDSSDITGEAITGYFAAHRKDFVLREDIALLSMVLFDDRDAANTFRTRVLRGASWENAVTTAQRDSLLHSHLLRTLGRQFFSQSILYPVELWKVARTLQPEAVSFVVSTDEGYYVLRMHDFKKQGEEADIEYVTEEIRDHLMIEARRQMYDSLLAKLRSRFPVEVRLNAQTSPSAEKDEE